MVETLAELPFIGDRSVCLSHYQAARPQTDRGPEVVSSLRKNPGLVSDQTTFAQWQADVEKFEKSDHLTALRGFRNVGLAHRNDPNVPDRRVKSNTCRVLCGDVRIVLEGTMSIVERLNSIIGLTYGTDLNGERHRWGQRAGKFGMLWHVKHLGRCSDFPRDEGASVRPRDRAHLRHRNHFDIESEIGSRSVQDQFAADWSDLLVLVIKTDSAQERRFRNVGASTAPPRGKTPFLNSDDLATRMAKCGCVPSRKASRERQIAEAKRQ
jgi:hypothetical protein